MQVNFTLNGSVQQFDCAPGESLLSLLRRAEVWSVKHGCETGECGACSVLFDGALTPTCVMLAAQADGHLLFTVEGLSAGREIHPLQQAFIDAGAIQCGYCTPAMLLAAKALLDKNPQPTAADARSVLSGVLCRCTGYVKPVEAILRAAALLRGEAVAPADAATPPAATAVVGHAEP
jgi:putative selenate reductase molybdopterin-binding subunit